MGMISRTAASLFHSSDGMNDEKIPISRSCTACRVELHKHLTVFSRRSFHFFLLIPTSSPARTGSDNRGISEEE